MELLQVETEMAHDLKNVGIFCIYRCFFRR